MQTETRSENIKDIVSHPDYTRWVEDWKTLNDTVDGGSSTVKKEGQRYLPATSGQLMAWNQPMPNLVVEDLGEGRTITASTGCGCTGQGAYAYSLYKKRATWYDYPAQTVRTIVGRLTDSPPTELKLPSGLQELENRATDDNQTFERFVSCIFTEQAKYSRCGVLADFPEKETTAPPYMTVYGALRVLNWSTERNSDGDEVLKWVILDESKYVQDGATCEYRTILRVCAIDESGDYFTEKHEFVDKMSDDEYRKYARKMLEPTEKAVYPTYKGKKAKQIPFVFINATNIYSTPELPILNTVTEMSLAIYRGEADYRQALFVQGQATPTFSGATPDEAAKWLLGANGSIASQNEKFKAQFMEVSGGGLTEMRTSQENLHNLAKSEGMKLINAGANESGDALKERTTTETVSLTTLVDTCETGLKKLIGIIIEWGGITGEVELKLNREFTASTVTPDDALKLVQAYNSGAPMTKKDMHEYMREGGLVESTIEEALEELDMTGRSGNTGGEDKKGDTSEDV
jgi:hypothetical protein